MRTLATKLIAAGCVLALSTPILADWYPGDGHKMHFPQLPDPFGWDVNGVTPMILADDWQCSETGPVTDIHVWGSWLQDTPGVINEVRVSIHENIPEDPTNPDSYSQPGALLWAQSFGASQLAIIDPWGSGDQGWYDPATGVVNPDDHHNFHQINIDNITDPFIQDVGEIYWLSVSLTVEDDPTGPQWGWKTSQDHFMDNAVWSQPGSGWQELYDPIITPPQQLDFAFVISPEPGTMALLLLGGLALARRRHRRSASQVV